jgi:hypothetical protein
MTAEDFRLAAAGYFETMQPACDFLEVQVQCRFRTTPKMYELKASIKYIRGALMLNANRGRRYFDVTYLLLL